MTRAPDPMIPPVPGAAAADWRPVGWAGLLFEAPREYRFHRIEGRASKGMFSLADLEQVRLSFNWATASRRRFQPEAYIRKTLRTRPGKELGPTLKDSDIEVVENPHAQPLLMVNDPAQSRQRYLGFFPRTRRLVECVYRPGEAREDRLVRQVLFPGLCDQPLDLPTHWAFFGVSFVAPAGFRYASSVLNLGDMRVDLYAGPSEMSGPVLTLRQIYPATMALRRQPLEAWMQTWAQEYASLYRARRVHWHKRQFVLEPIQTPRGPGLELPMRLRRMLRPLVWSAPRWARLWLVHDLEADKLIALALAHSCDRVVPLLHEVLSSLHWAAPQE